MALTLTVDGVDQTAALLRGSLRVTQTAGAREGRCDFTLVDVVALVTSSVVVADGATTYFSGDARQCRSREFSVGHAFCDVTAHDTGAAAAASSAPFSLSDVDPETAYTRFMGTWRPTAGWWRLGESSGTVATDEEAVQNGTYQGGPTLGVTGAMTGTPNTAATFNGTSQWVDVGSARLAGLSDFAIAAWVRSSTAANQDIYSEHAAAGTGARVAFLMDVNGRPLLYYRDNAGTANLVSPSSGSWNDGGWHHFAVTKGGTAVDLYVDGLVVKSGTLTATNTLTGTLLAKIGRDASATPEYFHGSLDEVMTWDYPSTQIPSIFAARDSRRYASLVTDFTWDGAIGLNRSATISTLSAGLAPGQRIAYSSALLTGGYVVGRGAVWPAILTVQEVAITWINATTPLYTVKIDDAPLTLAKAIKP